MARKWSPWTHRGQLLRANRARQRHFDRRHRRRIARSGRRRRHRQSLPAQRHPVSPTTAAPSPATTPRTISPSAPSSNRFSSARTANFSATLRCLSKGQGTCHSPLRRFPERVASPAATSAQLAIARRSRATHQRPRRTRRVSGKHQPARRVVQAPKIHAIGPRRSLGPRPRHELERDILSRLCRGLTK